MWGWKTVDRTIEPSVTFEDAKSMLEEGGFRLHISNPEHAVLKRAGIESGWTKFTPDGENLPLELAIAKSHAGLFIQLRYEHFVLFDTGDLENVADQIVDALSQTLAG